VNNSYSVLTSYNYPLGNIVQGYTNRTLYVNLTSNDIKAKPVSASMKDIFIGGRGFGLWLLWHATSRHTKWDDLDNELVISSGPLGGITQFPGSGNRSWFHYHLLHILLWIAMWVGILVPT
jgi:aldehyde:ferredoxin oxidoreductase